MGGLFLGALPTAFALVVIGSLVRSPLPLGARQGIVAVVVAALVLRETGLVKFPLPQNARQVPQFVTGVRFWGALQFGTEMGTGMRTYSPTGLPHATAIAVLLLASWPEALAAGAGFATGRSLMLVAFLAARDKATADTTFVSSVPGLKLWFAALLVPLMGMLI